MSDKPSSPVLPVFPEGDEPRRRRSPWWNRALRLVPAGWNRLTGDVEDFCALVFGFLWKNLKRYLRDRQLRRLLYGLPALAALLAAGVMGGALVQAARYDMRPSYRMWARQARADGNLELARVCYLRLLRENNPQAPDTFALSQILHELKQEEQADALLAQLAPLDGTGYLPAHVVRARKLLFAGKITDAARLLVDQNGKMRIDSREADAVLGQLFFVGRNWPLAEVHLLKAVPSDRSLAVLLMRIAEARGNADDRDRWAKSARDYYAQAVQSDPENVAARLSLAQALLKQKQVDYAAVRKVLRDGPDRGQRSEYHLALAQVYALEVRTLPKDKALADTAKRWNLVKEGLQEDPNNLVLLQQLLDMTHGSDGAAEQARARLQELLARGQTSAVLHMALGLDAYAQGKPEQARIYWERSFDLDKNMLVAANNVAWLLAHPEEGNPKPSSVILACGVQALLLPVPVESANLNRALELIEVVLKQRPDVARFRETHGQILVKMGRWKESVSDLEYALPNMPNKRPIHASLAKAYQELGLPELAEQHRKLAQAAKP